MKLYSLLNENNVLLGVPAQTLDEALRHALRTYGDAIKQDQFEPLIASLLERESQHPTLIDNGIYVPHTRLEWLDVFLLGLVVPEHPIPHPNPEQEPIAMFFMILAPQTKNTMMLQTLAAIARLIKSKETRQAIASQHSPARVIRLVEDTGIDVRRTLVASDIMVPVRHTVTTSMILAKAVDILVASPDEGVAVLDENRRLVGELTSRELMALGMPSYVGVLANPAMLDNFEPFENFFQHENNMTVREVCRRDIVTAPPQAPVVQISHLMMTHQKRRVYVVDDGEFKGIIYRKSIIERVLHI